MCSWGLTSKKFIKMRESENDCMNNCTTRNPKLGIGEVRASNSYIICAAIWFKDGQKHICCGCGGWLAHQVKLALTPWG